MFKKVMCYLPLLIIIASCATNHSWMRDYSRYIDNKTIGELSIPGTHFANAYNIKSTDKLCVGESVNPEEMSANASLRQNLISKGNYNQESFIRYLNTQNEDINDQLKDGIRYIELQICKQNNNYYTSNVYLTDNLADIITQIDNFVDSNPNEIVIIDLDNNLWADYGPMNVQDATLVYNYIITYIGHNFVPKTMRYNTISQLKAAHKQVVLLSSNPQIASFAFVWDKTQVAATAPAQYSTIQKISAIQTIFEQPENAHTLSIIPLYSALPTDGIDNGISGTNSDDPLILNYLNQTIINHNMILVTDSKHLGTIIDMTIPNNKNIIDSKESQ